MGNPDVRQVVPGDHNLFTGTGDIHINYELPPVEASERRVLLQFVDSVKRFWIDSFLKDSLHEAAMLELEKEALPDMVQHPWGRTLELPGRSPQPLAAAKRIDEIFFETGRALLILGEPGAGKTVTLVELARELIDRFESNPMQAAPVVLNLSTWQDKSTLATWIEAELKSKYFVPLRRSRAWLDSSHLILLLDGLDEVPSDSRTSCVRAINEFVQNCGLPGIVVCSRRTEYTALPVRLSFTGAVCLLPLTVNQIDHYLGSQVAALRQAIQQDEALAELAQTPLMLNIMSVAFQGAGRDELAEQKVDSHEERRKQIFRRYVERMFQRKGNARLAFPKEKISGWLSWLAAKMREHSQSVFLVEGLQPNWLEKKAERVTYGTIVALSLGLMFGLSTSDLYLGLIVLAGVGLGCWRESPVANAVLGGLFGWLTAGLVWLIVERSGGPAVVGLIGALLGGLICGLGVGSLHNITLVETLIWKWNQFLKRMLTGSIVGLIVGLIFGLNNRLSSGGLSPDQLGQMMGALFGGLIAVLVARGIGRRLQSKEWSGCGLILGAFLVLNSWVTDGVIGQLILALSFGLIAGLVGGLFGGYIGGITDSIKLDKAYSNQGIILSLKNSLAVLLVTCLAITATGGLIGWRSFGLMAGLIYGLFYGLILGLITGLNRGGSAVIKHYALRLTLWRSGYMPLKFVTFLDECSRLIFLKKVGGGYIFIHRMLLEYFADLHSELASTNFASSQGDRDIK
jgi:hypothetical protein